MKGTNYQKQTITMNKFLNVKASLILILLIPWNQIRSQCWKTISTGAFHKAALQVDGTLWCWGFNSAGQLGDSTNLSSFVPKKIGSLTTWKKISTGASHTLALKTDGTLWAWGQNSDGRLGDGTYVNRNFPVQIGTSNNWVEISAGQAHSLAIKSDGTLWAWGNNFRGQLGDPTIIFNTPTPTQIGNANNWQSISCGDQYSMAIKTNGALFGCGYNIFGQLGNGTNIDLDSFTQIDSSITWKKVSAGLSHTLAIKADGSLWAWGNNYYGCLGDGSQVDKNVPTQVGVSSNWQEIAASGNTSKGIKTDGTLWAWGFNSSDGNLGNGTTIDEVSPILIGTNTNWEVLSAQGVIQNDGTLWCWGANYYGEIGDGTNIPKLIPENISCNFPSFLEDLTSDEILIYPNPVINFINLSGTSIMNKHIEIMDLNGRTIFKTKLITPKIDLNMLSKGVYYLKIYENGILFQKIFIKS